MSKNIKIGIVDYEAGNLFAIYNACLKIGASPEIIKQNYKSFDKFDVLIIPGVGSFHTAMEKIKKFDLYEKIINFKNTGKTILGICLGMQLLTTKSYEGKETKGFNFIEADVTFIKNDIKKIKKDEKICIPINGWNSVFFDNSSKELLLNLQKKNNFEDFYFIHSYWIKNINNKYVIGESFYRNYRYCSCFKIENIIGVQFHPERSSVKGLIFLENAFNLKC